MLNFDVTHNCQYKELKVETLDGSLNTGLLDDMEALEIVNSLIMAAEELLPDDYQEQDRLLGKIRESLES